MTGKQVNGVTWDQHPGVSVQFRYVVLSSRPAALSLDSNFLWLQRGAGPEILFLHVSGCVFSTWSLVWDRLWRF